MLSRILRLAALALLLSATVRGDPPAPPIPDAEAINSLAALISKVLRKATTIVIADSKKPEGAIIREVIRGNALEFKVGERGDDPTTTFPRGPILIWQETGDIIGKLPAIPSTTSYHRLDDTKRFIVMISTSATSGEKRKVLVPLAEVLKHLKAP